MQSQATAETAMNVGHGRGGPRARRVAGRRPRPTLGAASARTLAMLAALAAAGCATGPPPPGPAGARDAPSPAARAGGWALSVVGTPIYIVIKSAVCVASLAIAAPASALIAINRPHASEAVRRGLAEGLSTNCGPPDVLAPPAPARPPPERPSRG